MYMHVVIMDLIYNLVYYLALFLIPFVLYFLLFKRNHGPSIYTGRGWFYLIKFYFAKNAVRKYQDKFHSRFSTLDFERNLKLPTYQHTNTQYFYGADQNGNSLSLNFTIRYEQVAEVFLYLRLSDGNVYAFPDKNHLRLLKIPDNKWKINGLNIEILEPLTRLRIKFNGLLQNISNQDYEKIDFVQFSFIFNACGSPTYIPHGMDTNLLADALAKDIWRDGSWVDYLVDQSGYEQFGALQGSLKGDSYPDEILLNLPASRSGLTGIDDRFLLKRALRIFIADSYGNLINLVIKSFLNGCSQMNFGSAILSDGTIMPIKGVDMLLTNLSCYKIIPEMMTIEVRVGKKLFKCVIHLNKSQSEVTVNEEINGFECYNVPAECDVNSNQGKAIAEFWYNKKGSSVFTPNLLLRPKIVKSLPNDFVINMNREEAMIINLTGGKGNSLALLSSLNSSEFIIPDGFIVSVNAFKYQLESNPIIAKAILLVEKVCCGQEEGNLENICNEVVSYIKKEKVLPSIVDAIRIELKTVGTNEAGWAVRSSAIGEDSEELSAAGQNDTFLGCLTEDQIIKAISACWASLFSYQSVQYRWQHGIPVLTEMAVVVQKMVPADSAGILFTCHPFTFNPSQMVITSNYGLGETVVSGKSDPDTFVLNRSYDDKVCLLDQNLGRKNKILKMTHIGVKEIDREEDFEFVENEDWSISESQALQLGRLGVTLERVFGGPRDIEWAYHEGKLYLLQSRPITTLNTWSDFDLTHELDYPIRSDHTILSIGNIGEVIPSAMSVLTQTTSMLCTSWASELRFKKRFDPLGFQNIVRRQHLGLIDVVQFLHKNVNKDVKVSSTILDLAVFGHPVFDEKMNEICKNMRGVTPSIDILKEGLEMLSLAWRNRTTLKEMKKMVSELKLEVNDTTALCENYKKIDCALSKLPYILKCHTETSSVSVFYQVVAMNTLLEGSKTLTKDHCADFALILSCCNDIISAEVPMYLENIAKIIRNEGYNEQFCTIKPEFGVTWLEKKCPEAYKLFREFIVKHGHRSQGEFEIMEESWRENPSRVIAMIQANAKCESSVNRSKKNVNDITKNLVSPKSSVTRAIIKFIITRIQSSVALRELTKAELVRAVDKLKQSYRIISKQMVSHGMLPSMDLLYHLTHHEIGQVIENRDTLLVVKAIRRKKLYPRWNKAKFPEISFGVPVPETETEHSESSVDKVCLGTAACAGTVKARACVIRSLQEIGQLQTGDILITVSTDIGWSPYFPMLSGIVTELGGLISHGAVVAREYGLPCIVGVREATKVFKTGDIVVLSGSTGKVARAANLIEVL